MPTVLGFMDARKLGRQSSDFSVPVKTSESEEMSDDGAEEAEFDRQAIMALNSERGQEATRKLAEHFKTRKLHRVIKR